MFHQAFNPIASYKKVEQDVAVADANPHQLIVLLFQGAEQAIALARIHMEQHNVAEKGLAISRAIDIITLGLQASLDVEAGGELAQNLFALYDYMARRLLQANLKNQVAALDEVAKLLADLRLAWMEIGNSPAAANLDSTANR